MLGNCGVIDQPVKGATMTLYITPRYNDCIRARNIERKNVGSPYIDAEGPHFFEGFIKLFASSA
jgi:hypothetical protein